MCGCMETWLISWENNDNNNINFIFSRILESLGANIFELTPHKNTLNTLQEINKKSTHKRN